MPSFQSSFVRIGWNCGRKVPRSQFMNLSILQRRQQSSSTVSTNNGFKSPPKEPEIKTPEPLPPLSVMPTPILLRTLMAYSFMTSPLILSTFLPIMDKMSTTKISAFNPDKNPILNRIVRLLFYNHFTAGSNAAEVKSTLASLRKMGYTGFILAYAKEIAAKEHTDRGIGNESEETRTQIGGWKAGCLETLGMLGEDDFLGIKFTGAGDAVANALLSSSSPPPAFSTAMSEIAQTAIAAKTRIEIDAEQTYFQDTIDEWTFQLMRTYNIPPNITSNGPPIYNTYQAYLKSTPKRLTKMLKRAKKEGCEVGIKLVRGAYIASERRELIHDTKAETDAAYDGLVEGLVKRTLPGIERDEYPAFRLFVAGHNERSVRKAVELEKEMRGSGVRLEYGQIQGMADELGCELLQMGRVGRMEKGGLVPRAYKATVWGSVQECLQYLVRRAVENKAATLRTREWRVGAKQEMWRRVRATFGR